MSNLSEQDIQKISNLAKIEISQDDCQHLAKQLSSILTWAEKLNEVNTDNVEPLVNIHGESLRLHQDQVNDGDIADDILQNSKDAKYGYFAVPKVIE